MRLRSFRGEHIVDILLIDNSNIFIGLNKFDQGARIDYIKFSKKFTGVNGQKNILVGSTPPPNDNFWRTMENNGFEVYTYDRTKNGEKGIDGKLLIEGVKHIERVKTPGRLILMSGDLDMRPLIEEAYNQRWEVILWSWKESLNLKYKNDDLSWCIHKINYLDDIEEDIIYFNYEIDNYIEKEYLRDRKIRIANEEKKRKFNNIRQDTKDKIAKLQYLDNKYFYIDEINELVDIEQISEINNILTSAQKEDEKVKAEKLAEQKREQEEYERKVKEEKEQKNQKRKEFFIEHWGLIVSGGATLAGGAIYIIKKITK